MQLPLELFKSEYTELGKKEFCRFTLWFNLPIYWVTLFLSQAVLSNLSKQYWIAAENSRNIFGSPME